MKGVTNDRTNGINITRIYCYYCKKPLWIQLYNEFIRKNPSYIKMCKDRGASLNVCKECFHEKG